MVDNGILLDVPCSLDTPTPMAAGLCLGNGEIFCRRICLERCSFSITAKLCRDSAGVVFYLGEKDGVIFTIDNNDIRYRDSNIEHS